jgi:hypothetical protein
MIRGLLMAQGVPQLAVDAAIGAVEAVEPQIERKVRRKVGKYQRAFGKNLKALKRKHPRSQIGNLMKRAHRMTRKEMKK